LAVECLQQGVADFVLKDRLGRLPFAVRRAREAFFSRQQRVRAEEELRRAQEELELRVKQRTAEPAAANAHLKSEIEERTRAKRYLESQYLITRITMERETLEEAAPLILQEICTSFDWQAGGLWRLDAAAGVLRFVDLWKQWARASVFLWSMPPAARRCARASSAFACWPRRSHRSSGRRGPMAPLIIATSAGWTTRECSLPPPRVGNGSRRCMPMIFRWCWSAGG